MYRGRVARDQELFKVGQFGTEDHNRKVQFHRKRNSSPMIGSKTSKNIKVNKQMDE